MPFSAGVAPSWGNFGVDFYLNKEIVCRMRGDRLFNLVFVVLVLTLSFVGIFYLVYKILH